MAENISKYTFSEVEHKLDIIRDDQGANKCLLGNGQYGELPNGGGTDIILDSLPTANSQNGITSGGVYTAIEEVKEELREAIDNIEPSTGTTVTETKTYDKFVVFCIAGQSNAVGYDESLVDIGSKLAYVSKDTKRIKQLGFYGNDNLQLIELGYCAQSMQDMRVNNRVGEARPGTKGLHLPLANLMLDYIPDDYGVLVLPIAYGGTGFTSGNNGTYDANLKKPTDADPKANIGGQGTAILKWGTGTAYYQTLRDRIIHALELNDKNLFAGIIWCQGENDMSDASGHKQGFEAMTTQLFNELNAHNNGALKARTPKGVFDKDIWYNMETVGYWYTQGQCQTIWNNYKAWNSNTYIEIPRTADSNDINGTGTTAGVRAKHYGNNAYQKIVAPRVLQKLIDMDTFGKRVNVVEPECKASGSASYPVVTEGTRTFVQADIENKVSDITFTVNENGDCQSSENLKGKFASKRPSIHFGEIFKMEFEVKRAMYWMVVEEDDTNKYSVLGLSGNYTRQFATITNGTLQITDQASSYPNDQYNFVAGDRVRVYRNADNSISLYRTNNNDGVFRHWFDAPDKATCSKKTFGFALGIAGNEFSSPFNSEERQVFADMKIQKQELFPNNKIMDMQIEAMLNQLKQKSV